MINVKAVFSLFHRGAKEYPLLPPNPGFNPKMVQRPLINAGDTGRYALDAFMVKRDSPVGGGTIPRMNPPGLPRNALAVTPQSIGIYGGNGSMPNSMPGTQGLVLGFRRTGL
jgi:hypothetical protein